MRSTWGSSASRFKQITLEVCGCKGRFMVPSSQGGTSGAGFETVCDLGSLRARIPQPARTQLRKLGLGIGTDIEPPIIITPYLGPGISGSRGTRPLKTLVVADQFAANSH